MELNQLDYFRTVAEYEHITRAAEHLHISQPSLSATISRLEKELGTELFTRTSNRITLNENGKLFLRHVDRIYTELEHGLYELNKNREASLGRISFCTYGPGITNDLIPRFLLTHPHVSVTHQTATPEEMVSMLDDDTIDFAISCSPIKTGEYDWIPLFADHMLVLISNNHPMSGMNEVNLRDLSHERFAVFNADKICQETTIQLCREAGFYPDIVYNGNEIALILTLVASNICVFLCQSSNGVFGKDDSRTSPSKMSISQSLCAPNTKIEVGILTRKNKVMPPAAEEFIDLIRNSYSGLNSHMEGFTGSPTI